MDVGSCSVFVVCSLLFVGCVVDCRLMFDVCRSLCVGRCVLFVGAVCCVLCVACCLFFVVCCLCVVVCCLLLVTI